MKHFILFKYRSVNRIGRYLFLDVLKPEKTGVLSICQSSNKFLIMMPACCYGVGDHILL